MSCECGVLTRALCDGAVPVVESAAEHRVFARLQHHVAANEPPHRAPAVSQQAAERHGAAAVVRHSKHQHAQIQQVALCCVPAPEDEGDVDRMFSYTSLNTNKSLTLLSCSRVKLTPSLLTVPHFLPSLLTSFLFSSFLPSFLPSSCPSFCPSFFPSSFPPCLPVSLQK